MGGWTVLYYIITYPATSSISKIISSGSGSGVGDQPAEPEKEYRPKIAGAMVLCPLVQGERRLSLVATDRGVY